MVEVAAVLILSQMELLEDQVAALDTPEPEEQVLLVKAIQEETTLVLMADPEAEVQVEQDP
jgi:hypothetical protein